MDYRELPLQDMSNALRFLSVDAVEKANSGHPGMPMGMADVITVLFSQFMIFNPQQPLWPNRDRFILSNGHGSMLQYALLHLTGYDVSLDDLKNFRQLHSKTPGHPEYGYTPGVETTTGPLGQGFANAVGMAIAQKIQQERFGEEIFDNKTYVTVGDGCLMEGISHEAAELAGHLKLSNLVVLFDDNNISIDGEVSLSSSTDIVKRFESYDFNVFECDGHDHDAIFDVLNRAEESEKPVLIAFKTHIGYGSPNKQDTSGAHGSPLGKGERDLAAHHLGWHHGPFEVPQAIYDVWGRVAEDGVATYNQWMDDIEELSEKDEKKFEEFQRLLAGEISDEVFESLDELKIRTCTDHPVMATRKAGGHVLDVIAKTLPEVISGSADLTGSVLTKVDDMHGLTSDDFSGRFIHYGVREHGMAAIMNGIALYGGLIPISGTFMSFLDYMRPSVRLSALMGLRVIYVMTHDSIGLGEDGPTHQPVEHLAMCRATPNLLTFRPADLVETIECYELALQHQQTPSVLALSRQNLPTVRTKYTEENLSSYGAYRLIEAKDDVKGIFVATGSEVEIAIKAHKELLAEGIETHVVSMPCMELFEAQEDAYKDDILPASIPVVAIEAAAQQSWDKYIGRTGAFIGMQGFGGSAPAEELYKDFGITAEDAVEAMKKIIK